MRGVLPLWDPAHTWRRLQESSNDPTNRLDPAFDLAFWERAAPGYHLDCLAKRVPEIVERVLRWIDPGDSVLELGAGSGGFSLPIARRAARVTALDYAPAMLRALRENLAHERLTNVRMLRADFETDDLEQHDVVFAANALYRVRDARPMLERMLAAAGRRLLVVWSVGRAQSWERASREIVAPGRYRPGADYIHLVDLLYDLGADAEIEILRVSHARDYPDAESAARALATWPDPSPDELERCQALLPMLFEPLPGGGYCARVHDRIALLRCEIDR